MNITHGVRRVTGSANQSCHDPFNYRDIRSINGAIDNNSRTIKCLYMVGVVFAPTPTRTRCALPRKKKELLGYGRVVLCFRRKHRGNYLRIYFIHRSRLVVVLSRQSLTNVMGPCYQLANQAGVRSTAAACTLPSSSASQIKQSNRRSG